MSIRTPLSEKDLPSKRAEAKEKILSLPVKSRALLAQHLPSVIYSSILTELGVFQDGGVVGDLSKSESAFKTVAKNSKSILNHLTNELGIGKEGDLKVQAVTRELNKFYCVYFTNCFFDYTVFVKDGKLNSKPSDDLIDEATIKDEELAEVGERPYNVKGVIYLAVSPRSISIRSKIKDREYGRGKSDREVVLWKIYNQGEFSHLKYLKKYEEVIKKQAHEIIEILFPPEESVGSKRGREDQDNEEDRASGNGEKSPKKKTKSS